MPGGFRHNSAHTGNKVDVAVHVLMTYFPQHRQAPDYSAHSLTCTLWKLFLDPETKSDVVGILFAVQWSIVDRVCRESWSQFEMHPNIETNPGTHSSPAVLNSAVRGQTGSSYREANAVCFQCCIIDFFFKVSYSAENSRRKFSLTLGSRPTTV